jgi:hypothetical protein
VERLQELGEGEDDVALSARVNLADYYRTTGRTDEAERTLAAPVLQAKSRDILYAADMMRGTMCYAKDPLAAVGTFKRAAMVASDRDEFRAAYEGIGTAIAGNQSEASHPWNSWYQLDADLCFPVLLCDKAEAVQRVWQLERTFDVVVQHNFGTLKRLDLVFGPGTLQQRTAFIGVIEDGPLYSKRRSLWGKDAFEIPISRDAIPADWRWDIPSGGVDRWGNSVVWG